MTKCPRCGEPDCPFNNERLKQTKIKVQIPRSDEKKILDIPIKVSDAIPKNTAFMITPNTQEENLRFKGKPNPKKVVKLNLEDPRKESGEPKP